MKIVLDTNVLVAAMLSGGGTPHTVLQLVLQREMQLVADSRILSEYYEVTARPRFAFDQAERLLLLDTLADICELVLPVPVRLTLLDSDDLMFVEAALAAKADAIVTGNVRHFVSKRGKLGVNVLTPRQLVDRLRRPL